MSYNVYPLAMEKKAGVTWQSRSVVAFFPFARDIPCHVDNPDTFCNGSRMG